MLIDPSSPELIHFLRYWGYPAMFLLMFLEGPFATMIAAFLASQGFFNIGLVFALSVVADVLGDIGLYHIGYYGGPKIIPKAQKVLKIKDTTIEALKNKFHQNSERLIFYVKSTTGLSYITFTLAGALRMKLSKFVKNSILGGLVWSSILVILGYFFGYATMQISQYIKYAGVIIFIGVAVFFIGLTLYKRKQAKEILK